MNKDQLNYKFNSIYNSNGDLFFLITGSLSAAAATMSFYDCNFINGAGAYLLSSFTAYMGVDYFPLRQKLGRHLSKITDENKYPLEYSERIVIADEEGLEKLLERTALEETLEWGTFLVSHAEGTTAIVDEILDSYEAEQKEYITRRKKCALYLNSEKGYTNGYNGLHHFHPLGNGSDYSVNRNDRLVMELNSLQLLTFNFHGEPEVIGYNKRYTYIPAEKNNKKELVRATPKQIMEYLRR